MGTDVAEHELLRLRRTSCKVGRLELKTQPTDKADYLDCVSACTPIDLNFLRSGGAILRRSTLYRYQVGGTPTETPPQRSAI